jgi:hypothetical protein
MDKPGRGYKKYYKVKLPSLDPRSWVAIVFFLQQLTHNCDLNDLSELCLVSLRTQSPAANRGMLPVVDELHIGRVGDHGDKDTPRHKDTTNQRKYQRISTNIGQPGFLERLVLLHGNKGR